MATIVTRSGKGSALTHTEMDANFNNLNAGLSGDFRDGITHVGRDTNDYIEIGTDRIRFYLNGVNVMSCDTSGNIIAKGNVTAYGTPI